MLTAREIMTKSADCIGEHDSLTQAAQMLRDLKVGRYQFVVRTTDFKAC